MKLNQETLWSLLTDNSPWRPPLLRAAEARKELLLLKELLQKAPPTKEVPLSLQFLIDGVFRNKAFIIIYLEIV